MYWRKRILASLYDGLVSRQLGSGGVQEATNHALYPTSTVAQRLVLKDRTDAATPDETPLYMAPVPTEWGSSDPFEVP